MTHDHDLIDEVATRLWVFREEGIEDFQGPYAEWKGKHNEGIRGLSAASREVTETIRFEQRCGGTTL